MLGSHVSQDHTHVEELPAGDGKHSGQGTQNHPDVEVLPADVGKSC